jgi:hypothetical protein
LPVVLIAALAANSPDLATLRRSTPMIRFRPLDCGVIG